MDRGYTTSSQVPQTIDELEALANGELDYDTDDTERFFANPRVGVKIKTPNGSTIRVMEVNTFQFSKCDLDNWLMAKGRIIDAPQCPEKESTVVTFLVKRDGTICLADQ